MKESLLINSVKSHEAIYNTKCTEYRDSVARHAAWASVAEICGSTVEQCKESWAKIRNCYTNAKKRRMRKSGQKFDRWRYEEEMSFLDPYLKERPPTDDEEVVFVEDSWGRGSNTGGRITASFEREHLLIDLVRQYEVIYNTKCREYRDAKERHAAWMEIADLHGSTVTQCKDAWIKLRNCYTNAIKRQYIKSAKNLPTTPWRFEKSMSFLRPHMNLRFNLDNTEALLYKEEEPWEDCSINESPEREVCTRSAYKRKANADFLDMLEENNPELMQLDDVDHFFLSMSKMAKKLPKIDQLRIKLDLHKAINEAELRQLDETGNIDGGCGRGLKKDLSSPRHATRRQSQEIQYLSYD